MSWDFKLTCLFVATGLTVTWQRAMAEEPSSLTHPWLHDYNTFLAEEQSEFRPQKSWELMASGVAAFLIGTYGLESDNRGSVTKALYSVTQAGGIVVFGRGIRHFYARSPLAALEQSFRENPQVPGERLRVRFALNQVYVQNERAKDIELLVTSSLLSLLFAHNGWKESGQSRSFSQISYFLSLNSLLLAGTKIYSLTRPQKSNEI